MKNSTHRSPLLAASFVGVAAMTKNGAQVMAFNGFPPGRPKLCSQMDGRRSVALSYAVDSDSFFGSPTMSRMGSEPKFIRLQPRTARGSRQCFELQTAVTTFERVTPEGEKEQIDLYAQLHFGDQDYFEYFTSDDFLRKNDRVLYELVVDQSMMQKDAKGFRYLPQSTDGSRVLMASPTDQKTALQYGLTCQVDVMDYSQPNWIHADLTRQEILEQTKRRRPLSSAEPIWALASTAPTWPGAEAISALFRPSTPSTSLSSPVARRLFSNLFLPGNALAGLLRAIFWVTVPSPELSVMLLDWSSIIPLPTGGVSQVALPVVESLLTGNIREARQLIFGQMLVNGQSSSGDEKVLIGKRNEHALSVLAKSLDHVRGGRHAFLYGCMHCPDLRRKLMNMGFVPMRTQWRTAWSVQVPSFGTGGSKDGFLETFAVSSSPTAIAIGLVILPLYFAIGGLDWIATLRDMTVAMEDGDVVEASFNIGLYLLRHVMLYLGLAKFVVEWDGGMNLFGNDPR